MSHLQQLLQRVDAQKEQLKTINTTIEGATGIIQPTFNEKCRFLSDSLAFSNLFVSKEQIKEILSSSDSSLFKEQTQEIFHTVTGYAKAFDFMVLLSKQQPLEITEDVIKHFHHLLFSDFENAPSDAYRTIHFFDENTGYRSPSPEDLSHVMPHLGDQFRSSKTTLHPVELSAMMSKRVLDIHPFMEGNKRIAHLMMNVILLHYGYPMISISKENQKNYESALHIARTEYDMEPFSILLATLLLETELH